MAKQKKGKPKSAEKSRKGTPSSRPESAAESAPDEESRRINTSLTVAFLQTRIDNPNLTLRVRQIDWTFHDITITLPRNSAVSQLQQEIARNLHGDSILHSDVILYSPKPKENTLTTDFLTVDDRPSYGLECSDSRRTLWQFLGDSDPLLEMDSTARLQIGEDSESPNENTSLIPKNAWKRIPTNGPVKFPCPHVVFEHDREGYEHLDGSTNSKVGSFNRRTSRKLSAVSAFQGGLGASHRASPGLNADKKPVMDRPIEIWYDVRYEPFPYTYVNVIRKYISSERRDPDHLYKHQLDIACPLLRMESKTLYKPNSYMRSILGKLAPDLLDDESHAALLIQSMMSGIKIVKHGADSSLEQSASADEEEDMARKVVGIWG